MSDRCDLCDGPLASDGVCADDGCGDTDFFNNADPAASNINLGPIFMAQFESEDSCCGEGIVPGEDIRADGQGGWIHADDQCERLVR